MLVFKTQMIPALHWYLLYHSTRIKFKVYVWHLYFLLPSCFSSCCPTHTLSITVTYLIKRMRPSGMNVLFSLWVADSQDDNITLQTSNVNFETERELTETSPGLKQDLKARPFSLIMPQLALAYFPKQYQRTFAKHPRELWIYSNKWFYGII